MTDTFPTGSSTPPAAGDVTGTLAELERKLRELERELTSIGRRRVHPEEATVEEPVDHAPEAPVGRLVDEQVEFSQPPAPAAPAAPPPAAPPVASTASAIDGERPRPTEAQLASLAELRRFRERLERFNRELLADYDAVLSRAMFGVSGRVPTDPAPPTPPLAPPPPPEPEEPLFEGRVEIGVGPFYDIGSLGDFERLVAAVPHVSDVSVRRFEASHAVVDVRLARPVALVSELRSALDTDFDIRQVAPGRIVLTFDEG